MAKRLKKGDITLREIYLLSLAEYKKEEIDDKGKRAELDIINGKLVARRGLTYNRSTKEWEQTSREIKFEFLVKSNPVSPVSQKRIDTITIHKYPVVILLKDISKGLDSPVRLRVGSNKRPLFPEKGASKEERVKIANKNIMNQIQLQWFFDSETIYKVYGILYGPDRTNGSMPKKANPTYSPYLPKHLIFIIEELVIPMIKKQSYKLNQIGKNKGKAG